MTDLHLHQALDAASAHLQPPDLTVRALEGARRRRAARRTAVAGVAAAAVVAGLVGWELTRPGPDAVDAPSTTPTASGTPTPSSTPTPSVPESDTDPATQPVWDPFTVVDAPRYASVLPEQVAPPPAPPSIADAPLPDIVLAWPAEGSDLRVLGSNGEWRSVPGTATAIQGTLHDVVTPALSPGGDQVAMATDAGILVVAAAGGQDVVPWPPELQGPFDTRPPIIWRPGDEGFVVLHWERPWLVDLEGNGEPAAFGAPYSGGVMVDPDDGTVLERRWKPQDLVEWRGDDAMLRGPVGGYGERFVTRFGRVAYVGNPGSPYLPGGLTSGPVVLDADSGEILAYAPIRDRDSVYSDNGHLVPLGFLDETTVLLLVTPMDFRTMKAQDARTHLVAWDHVSGSFRLIASGGPEMRTARVAVGLVASE